MEGETLTFARTATSRLASGSVFVLTGAGLGWIFSRGIGAAPLVPAVLLGFFFLLSAFLSVSNLWDRIEVDDKGIRIRNRVFESVGWRPARVAWGDIRYLEEHRMRTLFVRHAAGRRPLVLDAVAGYGSLRRIVQEKTGLEITRRRRKKERAGAGPDAG